jgi:hypothetical protein
VKIAKNENLKDKTKELKGGFIETGKFLYKCRGDSYLVKKADGRIVKKRHYDLKRILK